MWLRILDSSAFHLSILASSTFHLSILASSAFHLKFLVSGMFSLFWIVCFFSGSGSGVSGVWELTPDIGGKMASCYNLAVKRFVFLPWLSELTHVKPEWHPVSFACPVYHIPLPTLGLGSLTDLWPLPWTTPQWRWPVFLVQTVGSLSTTFLSSGCGCACLGLRVLWFARLV